MLEQMRPALLGEWVAFYEIEAEEREQGALGADMKRRAAGALEQARKEWKRRR